MPEFGILGPLEVRSDGAPVDLGGPRQRVLLAVLLIHANEPVGADVLMQALWGDDAPPTAGKALHVAVSRLRRALGRAGERLETAPGGYRLVVEPGELDAEHPEREELWRGPAFADLRYEPALQAEIRRLEDLRAAAIEDRVQAALDRGEHARLAGELETLIAEQPLRERLRAQHMLALYRSGRHADGLAAYRAARDHLDEELGLEPGPELRRLEQAILTHDPALAFVAREDGPPAPPTPTLGRDDDVSRVVALLGEARLLTLTGPGGVGKTRLAIEVARVAGGRFASLAAVADAERIPAVLCDALAVARAPGEPAAEALDRALGHGPTLLVVDNLEHLPDAGPLLAGLLERHGGLRILATSRQPAGIRAERLYPVAPLAASPAVELFVARARAGDPAFSLTRENEPVVAAVCDRLDGLPLAIELAAARLGLLTPSALADRLDDALGLLDRGPRDAPERQRTLRATLDWSLDLLDDRERDAFAALGAFAGGCELDAAEAVTQASLPVLESLVAKSLVIAHDGRLAMLEPVRQYAAERLAARPDADAVRARHVDHYVALAETSEAHIWLFHRASPALAGMRREHENLRAAFEWALASGRATDALRLASAFVEYANAAHAVDEARRWLERARAAVAEDLPVLLRGRAELAVGKQMGGGDRGRVLERALELLRAAGDEERLLRALIDVGVLVGSDGEYARCRALGEEALELATGRRDEALIGLALTTIALGDPHVEEALPTLWSGVARLRAAGAIERRARILSRSAMAALRDDAYEAAQALQAEALADAVVLGDPWTLAFVHGNMGLAALLSGDHDTAREAFRDELVTGHSHRFETFYFEALLGFAGLAAVDGDDGRAATLEGAAWALNDRPVTVAEAPVYERIQERMLAAARSRLGAVAWESARAAGAVMTADAAVAYALDPAAVTAS